MSDNAKPASGCTVEGLVRPRFVVVSDLPEWSVWDTETKRDLFPTKSGNRDYACKQCDSVTAAMIAESLNFYVANDQAQRPEGYAAAPCSMDKVLLMAWVDNLRQKARLIRKGVKHMDESCDELADIIEKYATSNASREA